VPAAASLQVELEGDRLLPDRAFGAHRVDDRRGHEKVLAGRHGQAGGRPAQVAQLDSVAAGKCRQLIIVVHELVQAALDVQAGGDASLQQLAPLRREASALRGDAHERSIWPECERLVERLDDGDTVEPRAEPLRVEQADDVVAPVADDAARRLAIVRVAGVALGQDQVPRHEPAADSTARARAVSSSSAVEPQSTASTLLPFEPGRFHQRPSTRQVPSGRRFDSMSSRAGRARSSASPTVLASVVSPTSAS
jgi:hypothetical protein